MHSRLASLLFCIAALTGCATQHPGAPGTTEAAPKAQHTVPREVLNSDVRQESIDSTICTPGYTASIRPSTSFTNGIKVKLLREAGLPAEAAPSYELDHHVPLSVGGHPRNLRNLALQKWGGEDGAKRKDRLERRLQAMVCSRQLSLTDAQWAIYSDWPAAYKRFVSDE